MSPGLRKSAKQLCRVGVTLLLVVQALSSLLNNPLMNSYAEVIVDYASLRSAADVRAAAEKNISLRSSVALDNQSSMDATYTLAKESALGSNTMTRSASEVGSSTEETGIEAPSSVDPKPMGSQLAALGDDALDDIRGGFEPADSNLRFTFGIERAVYINGELVARTVFHLKDMQSVAGRGSAPQELSNANASAAAAALGVVQNGPNNGFTAQIGSNLAGTVVQNTLDNQRIQNVTTVNAAVNSAQLFRSMSVQTAIQHGIVGSLRH